jgi:phosphoglycerate dehydrogenase-like enzyme
MRTGTNLSSLHLLILLPHPFKLWNTPPWFAERLRAEFPQLRVTEHNTYDGAEESLRDADILMAWNLRPEQFAAARKLRWIYSPAAAVHGLLIPEIIASDIVITNAAPVNGPVAAEHAIALLLALSKRLDFVIRAQVRHLWSQQQLWEAFPRPREVRGATLTLIGLGQIGGVVARMAAGLGMRVLGVRGHPERGLDWLPNGAPAENHATFGTADLDQALTAADYVVLAAPLTPSTQHLMDARRFSLMKRDACFINISRGGLVDEVALIEALRAKHIGGAALDVFVTEPLPEDSPLWDMDNVIVTPHSGGMSEHVWERQYELFTENLRRFLAGQSLLAEVDKKRGY